MEITLYLQAFRRGWWIIALTLLVSTFVSLLISYFTPPVYQAVSRFIISPNAGIFSNSWDIVSSLDTLDRRSIVNTYKELLASQAVYERSLEIQNLGNDVISDDYIITVTVIPDTNILSLTVEGPDPEIVVKISNAIGREGLEYINQLYPVYNFNILEAAEFPTEPIRPEPAQNAALAALLGAIVGVVLAFSREQLQNTIEKLRERSIIDVASSAYTRLHFERRLREEMNTNPDANISVGIINFRGLEEVSDILPQPITDRLIHQLTQTLKSELRGRDIVGRWSKSRLSVLLPNTPNSSVEATFRRIQIYLSAPIYLDKAGDMVVNPDPCIGVVARDQFESEDEFMRRAESAVDRASSLKEASVIFLAKPFVFTDANEIN
ncbi:MAG TPA: diguanylate cyclase [Anaerolineales bacterium]|nr:diguanylate cyclase [Anaerolineales bacterium]